MPKKSAQNLEDLQPKFAAHRDQIYALVNPCKVACSALENLQLEVQKAEDAIRELQDSKGDARKVGSKLLALESSLKVLRARLPAREQSAESSQEALRSACSSAVETTIADYAYAKELQQVEAAANALLPYERLDRAREIAATLTEVVKWNFFCRKWATLLDEDLATGAERLLEFFDDTMGHKKRRNKS